jgi:hypothetical protein
MGGHVDDVAGGETEAEPAIGKRPVRDRRIAAVELGPPLQVVQENDVARSKPLVLSLQRSHSEMRGGEAQSRCRCVAQPSPTGPVIPLQGGQRKIRVCTAHCFLD